MGRLTIRQKTEATSIEQLDSFPQYAHFSSNRFPKPEKEIFQLAEKEFHMLPEETLYVGDNYDNDVLGAKSANWQALWFNHRERKLNRLQFAISRFLL